jgi:hypothetical protein
LRFKQQYEYVSFMNAIDQLCLAVSRSHRLPRLICLLAAFALAGVVLAANSIRGHGRCTGVINLTSIGGTLMNIQINTTGVITHLGKSTVTVSSTADFSGPVPVPVPPSYGVVTAANGDTVSFTLKWTAQTINAGIFEVTGPFEVTGGTGRFTGASGNGNYRGRININNGSVSAEVDGTLTR